MEEDCGAFCSRLCCSVMLLPVCLVLQVTWFVFFKIPPLKLVQKMKQFAKRRCGSTLKPAMEEDVS
ncbi:unnamed protein product [Eruca vesicaria subsp. sativa]|uniref:Uncharacterized protein n=1 Tax=Eruca vesicaria subsp. sativa TaxID=29727 RepID=A0ABC8K8W3_ERUVS|nr:unnamed protein product [Eruca vesicaria subsp. sativa]